MIMKKMLCNINSTLFDALKLIKSNKKGAVFVTDDTGKLRGVLTLGDVVILLLKYYDLNYKISNILRKKYYFAKEGDSIIKISARIPKEIRIVPIVNKNGQVVNYFEPPKTIRTSVPISEPDLHNEELRYLLDAFLSTWISSTGKYINKFEKEFSDFCGCKYGVATSNGTTALHLGLTALGISRGDEVIVPDLTFAASINAVLHAGATPVIVDVEKDSWTIDPKEIEKAITCKTKAIMPVHIYGQPCGMDEIMKIAKKHKLFIVEDCAEAHGAKFKNKTVGGWGDVGCFSFYANKIITTGEGGMCVTNSRKLYDRMRVLRDHGMSKEKKYWHEEVGFNYRMTNLQAAIGCAQLETINDTLIRNEKLNNRYEELLKDLRFIEFQKRIHSRKKITWLVSMLTNNGKRDLLLAKLLENKIDARPFFYSLSEMPIYKRYSFSSKNSLAISRSGISLPTGHNITDSEILRAKKIIEDTV